MKRVIKTIIAVSLIILSANTTQADGGGTWTTYQSVNSVQALAIQGSHLWVGTTKHGIVRWDLATGDYTRYTTADGLVSNVIYDIAIDQDGSVWFATRGGVNKFYEGTWTTQSNFTTRAIAIDHDRNKWFRVKGGIGKFDGMTLTTYTANDNPYLSNGIADIAVDNQGNIWAGTSSSGVLKFDGSSWITYTENDGLARNYVTSIAAHKDGSIWVGTEWSGVSKFDGITWTNYSTADGLASNWVRDIVADQEGNIWVGSYGQPVAAFSGCCLPHSGLSKFDGTAWTTYTPADGLVDDRVTAITVDNAGNKWFGTLYDGVSKFDDSTWTTYASKTLANNRIADIVVDNNNNKWFATSNGLSKFDGQFWTIYLAGESIPTVVIDQDGTVWAGGNGIKKFDGTTWTTYLSEEYFFVIAVDHDGNIWAGSDYYTGLKKFDGTTWTTILSNIEISAIAVDQDGSVWIGTGKFTPPRQFDGTTWTIHSGHISSIIGIVVDSTGNKWFVSRFGEVGKFDGTTWTIYDRSTHWGVPAYPRDMAIDQDDGIWVGDFDRISKFDGDVWLTFTEDRASIDYFEAIAIDLAGDIWVGSREIGVRHYEIPEALTLNYTIGTPDSYFNLRGSGFPPNQFANLSINGIHLAQILVGSDGTFTITLNTATADVGVYVATVSVDLNGQGTSVPSNLRAQATTSFLLDATESTHPQLGNYTQFTIPASLAFKSTAYLPTIQYNLTAQIDPIFSPNYIFAVNNEADTQDGNIGDGICETEPGNRICTLRAALTEANALLGPDTIILPPGTYRRKSVFSITDDLTLIGAGASQTFIDAIYGRVVSIDDGVHASIYDVTIMNGSSQNFAGGIDNRGHLKLVRSKVTNNSAYGRLYGIGGGGILNTNIAEIFDSEILDNGTELDNDNTESLPMYGGGIANIQGEMTIHNTTIARNQASGLGGGIYNEGGTLSIINSTISQNDPLTDGGGIYNTQDGVVILLNTTVVSNTGSGIENDTGVFHIENSLIAGNSEADCVGLIASEGHNLSSDTSCNWTDTSDLISDNPKLSPLKDNGGPVSTHALLVGSPAIDAGNNLTCAVGDQRSMVRPLDGDDDNNAICDIGAVEYEAVAQLLIIDESTPGFYNEALGATLDGSQAQFPTPEDADLTFLLTPEPDLSAASDILGGWLTATDFPVNEHWQARSTIPTTWDINTETAIVYVVDVAEGGISNLRGDFGVDNGFFVWVNGEFKFGALDAGFAPEYEYRHIDLGSLPAGRNYIQILREDHGVATDWNFRIIGAIQE
ncbi:MAG: two-component regulator propeller domain-containing protein [Chloroflexota bacterium]